MWHLSIIPRISIENAVANIQIHLNVPSSLQRVSPVEPPILLKRLFRAWLPTELHSPLPGKPEGSQRCTEWRHMEAKLPKSTAEVRSTTRVLWPWAYP